MCWQHFKHVSHVNYRTVEILEHSDRSTLGSLREIWLRSDRKSQPASVERGEAVEGHGLAGDCHADFLSPRQLLVVGDSLYNRLSLPPGSLRENLRINCDIRRLEPGMLVAVGASVVLWLTFECDVCPRLNKHRWELMKEVGDERGVLARVLAGGSMSVGDSVICVVKMPRQWPASWRHRIARVVASVPDGHVVEYGHLARLAGVPRSYCRVFPKALRDKLGASAERAVSSGESPEKPRWMGHDFFSAEARQLLSTGVMLPPLERQEFPNCP